MRCAAWPDGSARHQPAAAAGGSGGAGLEGVLIGLAVGLGTVLVIELVDEVR